MKVRVRGSPSALLSLTPALISCLHCVANFSPVFLQLFPDLRPSKKEMKNFGMSTVSLWCLSLLLVRGHAQGTACSGVWPSLNQDQDRHHQPRLRTWPGDQRRVQPSAQPRPGVLAQITTPRAVRDQWWLALRLTLRTSQSINTGMKPTSSHCWSSKPHRKLYPKSPKWSRNVSI